MHRKDMFQVRYKIGLFEITIIIHTSILLMLGNTNWQKPNICMLPFWWHILVDIHLGGYVFDKIESSSILYYF